MGIVTGRSIDTVLAIFAVLKCGAAYLPIDLKYPEQRLNYMLRDAGCGVVLAKEPRLLPVREGVHWLTLDDLLSQPVSDAPVDRIVSETSSAYVIYTSGTTGEPKGTVVTHLGLANLVRGEGVCYSVAPSDRFLWTSSPSFDVSVWETFLPLASGATLVCADEADMLPGADMWRTLRDQRITSVFLVPASLMLLPTDPLPDLRLLVFGGDVCPADVVERWLGVDRVFNGYGPTEATVFALQGDCKRVLPPIIGRPLKGTRAYVLDEQAMLVPPGVPGELCLGGLGVARGYLGRPDLTAERFVPDPFVKRPGARMYRTGDMARWLPNGDVEFLGRRDHQVKVRGFRIELTEIESALLEDHNVAQAVVVAKDYGPGDRRLLAYCTSSSGERLDTHALKRSLGDRLPAYMMPAVVTQLDALPLTVTGKVDRRSLPDPERVPDASSERLRPTTPLEERLAKVWEDLLRVPSAGVNDNFFYQGGDSILAIQLASHAREAGIEVRPRQVFEMQTLGAIAKVARWAETLPAEPVVELGDVPLTPVQRWFFERKSTNPSHFNLAVMFECRSSIGVDALSQALDAIVEQHDGLRLRFFREHEQWRQHYVPVEQARVSIEEISLPEGDGEALEQALARVQRSLDIERGPLLRVALLRRPRTRERLLIVLHHLVSDTVSLRVLLEDLEQAYSAAARREPIRLPQRTSSFRKWSTALAHYAESEALLAESEYWLSEAYRGVKPLPRELTGRHENRDFRTLTETLTTDESRQLLTVLPRHFHATIQELLLTPLLVVLAEYAGQDRILLEGEGHGRENIHDALATDRSFGWFTALYPLVLSSNGASNLVDTLRAVKDQHRRLPHNGIGYGILRYLGADPALRNALAQLPVPEVHFEYMGQFDQVLARDSELSLAEEGPGATRPAEDPADYLFNITVLVVGGRLSVSFSYGQNRHTEQTVSGLVRRYTELLRELSICDTSAPRAWLPSDFPGARLDPSALERLLRSYGDSAGTIDDVYALTPTQRGILFHSIEHSFQSVYVPFFLYSLEGTLDVAALERAWQRAIERQSVLRTSFAWESSVEPVQVVWHEVSFAIEVHDLAPLEAGERQKQLDALVRAERARVVDPRHAPLLHVVAVRLGAEQWKVGLGFHHLILDGWSLPLLIGEVFGFYRAIVEEHTFEPAAPVPFGDFVRQLQRRDEAQALKFWRDTLAALPQPTLVADALPAAHADPGAGSVRRLLSPELDASLRAFANTSQCTLGTVLQGVWGLLLSRVCDAPTVVFGNSVSGRDSTTGSLDLVGLCINTVPTVVQVAPERSVAEWLKGLQTWLVERQEHDHLGLGLIQEAAGVDPLFDCLFVIENYPVKPELVSPATGLRIVDAEGVETTNYPLTVVVGVHGGTSIELKYDPKIFDERTIANLLTRYQSMLARVTRAERAREVTWLDDGEVARLVAASRGPVTRTPSGHSIPELFYQHAVHTPDALAIVEGETRFSYREVDEKSDALAQSLRRERVGVEAVIGLCADRSARAVIAMLAILKVGAVYLPIDPAFPAQRIASMLRSARANWVLADDKNRGRLADSECRILPLDLPAAVEAGPALPSVVDPDQLAYVMFTSGSTGEPKGIGVCHRAITRLVTETNYLSFSPGQRFSHHSSISFDAATFEIWGALANGATLVLIDQDMTLDPQRLAEVQRRGGVNVAFFTTALVQQIAREAPAALEHLDTLLFGGEVADIKCIQGLAEALPSTRLIHVYGPTETTTFATYHPVPSKTTLETLPIGRALSNTDIFVLDSRLELVPEGMTGELYIGGAGLARGYLNRAESTAAAFLPNPFVGQGERMYRTGDRVRRVEGGALEFLGRKDGQVKLRGFRIELAEIEAALREHEQVEDAVVVVRDAAGGSKQLAAFFTVSGAAATPSTAALRECLGRTLPSYMIPSSFDCLDSLPLSAHGKVDRRALTAYATTGASATSERAARTRTEYHLLRLFRELLDDPTVGPGDSFFERGGHSLLVARLSGRILAEFQVELPLRAVFEERTVEALAARIDSLTARGVVSASRPIPKLPARCEAPLSFAQERVWMLEQLDSTRAAYNISVAVRFVGELQLDVLERAFQCLLQRHEGLRTGLVVRGGQPHQTVVEHMALNLELTALAPSPNDDEFLQQVILERTSAAFDLEQGPLFRIQLLRLAEREHVLVLVMHHLISDGWSLGVLIKELSESYQALCAGMAPHFSDLPISSVDFAAWQREAVRGAVLEQHLAYWKQALEGMETTLIPRDRPAPPSPTFACGVYAFQLDAETAAALAALSQRSGVTLFMTLLAAFQVLLFRHTGQGDIVVGSPIANRARPELANVVGFLVDTLPLRARPRATVSFERFLQEIAEAVFGALAHQNVPLEQVLRQAGGSRDGSRAEFYSVVFSFQNTPSHSLDLPSLNAGIVPVARRSTQFDLTLDVQERPSGLAATFLYSLEQFNESTLARLAERFVRLLRAIGAHPAATLSQLDVFEPAATLPPHSSPIRVSSEVSEAERSLELERRSLEQQLAELQKRLELVTAAAHSRRPPRFRSVLDRLSEQVKARGSAEAVRCGDEAVSYAELESEANRWAAVLKDLGVGPEVRVGLCVERSLKVVIGILAILKAGGAYVPLDPMYPPERLTFMAGDAGVSVMLTEAAHTHLWQGLQAPVLSWEALQATAAAASPEPLSLELDAEQLAYVIYTSGSTGRPKGSLVTHSNLSRLFQASESEYDFSSADVWTLFHSYSFDFSVWELWGALLYGGRLIVVPYWTGRSSESFYDLLERERVTVLNQTPSAFVSLMRVDEARRSELELRYVIFGGESLDPSILRGWMARRGDQRPHLINMYGITETTVHVTYRRLRVTDLNASSLIGKPLEHLSVHVLDSDLRALPAGVKGELYVGGAGVSRGYQTRPELTAIRFVPDPFGSGRLYRTGDLGRWTEHGELEYLGRADNQVKLRGFRIELGEIEATLRQHPDVTDSVVVLDRSPEREPRLIGYALSAGRVVTPQALAEFLADRVPEYMVPSALVVLDEFPLTQQGKVDRKALPAPSRLVREEDRQAPRTPTEFRIAKTFCEVLRLDHVGVTESFFDLGGHSLLATQVVGRVRQDFDVNLSLRGFFENPTVEKLALDVERAVTQGESASYHQIPAVGRDREFPLSFSQYRMWVLDQVDPERALYNLPLAMRLRGPLDAAKLRRAVDAVAERHEVLRTTFAFSGEQPTQVIHPRWTGDVAFADLSELDESAKNATIRRYVRDDANAPFDLVRGPIFRVQLLRCGPEDHVLLVAIHHIAADGWSLGVLLRDFAWFYAREPGIEAEPLPPLPIQYADFALWQQKWLSGQILADELAYWVDRLSDAPPVLELPMRGARPTAPTHEAGSTSFLVTPNVKQGLEQLCKQEGVTLYMALLAAFKVVLGWYSGQSDIVVGSLVANRNRPEVEGLVGFFVNTLAIRTSLAGDPSFRALLGRVRETALGAYAHQDLPFEKLVEALDPPRMPGVSPVFQVMFMVQNTPDQGAPPAALELELIGDPALYSKFDLTLCFEQTGAGLVGALHYAKEVFATELMQELAEQIERVLAMVANDPARHISSLLSPSAQDTRLLEELSLESNTSDFPLVHAVFDQQATQNPTSIALVADGGTLTYAELQARANRLARYLRERGVKPEARVGILLERSLEQVQSILAVLKAGAAYVPLDPEQPRLRAQAMLEDANIEYVLTRSEYRERLPEHVRAICLDQVSAELDRFLASAPEVRVEPEQLAYVIFTSGSTGRPKGVEVEHRALANHMAWMLDRFEFTRADTFLQKTPFGFDASVWEFFAPLMLGARLLLARPDAHTDPHQLVQIIRDESISVLQVVPSLLHYLLDEAGFAECRTLAYVFAGGEALTDALRRRFARTLPATLVNLYGPTEACIDATFHVCSRSQEPETVPIGRAICGCRVEVLGRYAERLSMGVPGQLYIAGRALARGYASRPDLTAERFVPDPLGEPGSRMYRTGDRARHSRLGDIEYLGRVDDQLKLHGHRVELGDIEAAIASHPGVRQAVAAVYDGDGAGRLIGYFVRREGAEVPLSDLRAHVMRLLPLAVVPAIFIALERLPLTASGKLDRRRLPPPEPTAFARDGFREPRTRVEQALAELWSQLLKVERVGLDDGFFALGGDSILSIQMSSRARAAGIELTPKQIMQEQTLERLALVAKTASADSTHDAAVPSPSVLTPIQRWFVDRLLPEPNHWNISLLIECHEPLEPHALREALDRVVEHHSALRSHFVQADGRWRQHYEPGPTARILEFARIEATEEDERTRELEAICAAAQRSLDLATGPLFRLVSIDRGPGLTQRLLIVAHHLIMDGVSLRVLLEDLEVSYVQQRERGTIELPLRTASFAEWARKLQELSTSTNLLASLPYWQKLLREPIPALPRDHASGENLARHQSTLSRSFDRERTVRLLRRAGELDVQQNELLLAPLVKAIAEWQGDPRVLLDLESHGRSVDGVSLSTDRTVGWFTAIYPILVDVDGARNVHDVLRTVRSVRRRTPDAGVGFGLLRYSMNAVGSDPLAKPSREPELIFDYFGQFEPVATDSKFSIAPESPGPMLADSAPRSHLLNVVALVSGGCFSISIQYSSDIHGRTTIEELADRYLRLLEELVFGPVPTPNYSLSEFPGANLSTEELATALAAVQRDDSLRIEDVFPLTKVQQGILFHCLANPAEGLYAPRFIYTLDGPLDTDKLEQAFRRVLPRHDILRAAIAWRGLREPHHVVLSDASFRIPVEDWSPLSAGEQRCREQEFLHEKSDVRAGLSSPPLFSLSVKRVDETRNKLLFRVHHLVLDGWSLAQVLREVFATYWGLLEQQAVALPESPTFARFVAQQRLVPLADAERFWRRELCGSKGAVRLADVLQRGDQSGQRSCVARVQPAETAILSSFCRDAGITVSSLLQGAWALLLSRYTGVQDVMFGTTVSGRGLDFPGIEALVGVCINTLPARIVVDGTASPRDWLARVHESQLEARDYEHTPLTSIAAWSGLTGEAGLFESILVIENFPVHESITESLDALRLTAIEGVDTSNYALGLSVHVSNEVSLELKYSGAAFSDAAMQRVLADYIRLVSGLAAKGSLRVGDVDMFASGEPEALRELAYGPALASKDEGERKAHALFEAWARRQPNAPALVGAGESMTYGALEQQANAVARRLRDWGIGPESRVALCAGRSFSMVAAMLGILKAGGAYVPLDPTYPSERLNWMLDDVEPALLVCEAAFLEELADPSCPVLTLEEAVSPSEAAAVTSVGAGNHLAYVIYTSGSTGTPKGVMVEHAALCNLVEAQREAFGISPRSVVLQYASPSFDASVSEVFVTLGSGASLCLRSEVQLTPGEDLLDVFSSERISVVTLPPSSLAQLPWRELPDLETLIVAGEACAPPLASAWRRGRRLVNAYGPTETTVCASMANCTVEQLPPVIGRPIANSRIHVLTSDLNPIPTGVIGEVFVGGLNLSRGYHRRPELTAERFVPDPFSHAGDRLYRTGDRARLLPDGQLEYVGRNDRQVKLRGYRIELGEVEALLCTHPAVKDAVAVVRRLTDGGQQLLAYVRVTDAAPAAGEIREFIERRAPRQLVPGAIIPLDAWPLTSNGKLAIERLPAPEHLLDQAAPGFRGVTETKVAELMSEVLEVDVVSSTSSFFDLGGHSLLATQLISRVRQAFRVELSLRTVFDHRTVAELAQAVEQAQAESSSRSGSIPLTRVPRDQPLPLSFGQQRLWVLDQVGVEIEAHSLALAVQLRGELDAPALCRAIDEVVRRHEVLRATFHAGSPPYQRFHEPRAGVTECVGLEQDSTFTFERARALLEAHAEHGFDLGSGPLFRALLVRVHPTLHLLQLSVHHSITDGTSLALLIGELVTLYDAFRHGRPSPLPELEFQYADFAVWQRKRVSGPELERQLGYWTEQLAGAPASLDLPTDFERSSQAAVDGACYGLNLSPATRAGLEALAAAEGATLYMVLLAGFHALLARMSHQSDIIVGSALDNRDHPGLERLLGFFVNTLPIRCNLAENPSFQSLVQQVRHTLLQAFEHQQVPFEKIVDELKPTRIPGRAPLFQVGFSMREAASRGAWVDGLDFELIEQDRATILHDLWIEVNRTPSELTLTLLYRKDLFERESIALLADRYRVLLESAVSDPTRPVGHLHLLSEHERHLVIDAYNATLLELTRPAFIHRMFEQRAEQQPQAIALDDCGRVMTYAELNDRANRLAWRLVEAGVGPDVVVGLYTDRSFAMVVAMMGILKAGGAYLPLDQRYPSARLEWMMQDLGVTLLVTQAALSGALQGPDTIIVVDPEIEPGTPGRNPEVSLHSDNLAYVIYTSGSTGVPKGVLVSHRGIPNLAELQQRQLGVDEHTRVLQFATAGFDASVWEIPVTLALGATLCLAPWEQVLPGEPLAETLRSRRISFATLPPSILSVMRQHDFPELTQLVLAGETCAPELIRAWGPGRRLFNAYGPTEDTVCASFDEYAPDVPVRSVGYPIPNNRLYVLDEGAPALIGAVGELCIGGDGLARGYANRPDLTAERFVPDPFGPPGSRLYRTGDHVRRATDGRLLYVGRIDHQIKLRGNRIEFGEIEAVLASLDGIDLAVVAVQDGSRLLASGETASAEARLVAYFTRQHADPRSTPSVESVRNELAGRLPPFMVPAMFVALPTMPLSANGKIDRSRLPLATDAALVRREHRAPTTPIERALASVWSELLQTINVGLDDSFYALGGDSISSIQVSARARALGIEVSPRSVLQEATLENLARTARVSQSTEQISISHAPFALTPPQLAFFEAQRKNASHFNLTGLFRPLSSLSPESVAAAATAVANHHPALSLRFAREGGRWTQQFASEPARHVFAHERLAADSEQDFSRQVEEAAARAQQSLDLEQGPLFKVALFEDTQTRQQRLLIIAHHLTVDAVSWRFVLEDLMLAYDQHQSGLAPSLPAPGASYREWSKSLERLSEMRAVRSDEGYWQARLPANPPRLRRDFDGPNRSGDTASLGRRLTSKVSKQLLALTSTDTGARMNEVLLAALAPALQNLTHDPRCWVETDWHGRGGAVDGSSFGRTVGWFSCSYPVLVDLERADSAQAVLDRVRRELRAVPHQGASFGLLRYLANDADGTGGRRQRLSEKSQPETLFQYLGRLDGGSADKSPLVRAQEDCGPLHDPDGELPHVLRITTALVGAEIEVLIQFSEQMYRHETIELLADEVLRGLEQMAGSEATSSAEHPPDPRGATGTSEANDR